MLPLPSHVALFFLFLCAWAQWEGDSETKGINTEFQNIYFPDWYFNQLIYKTCKGREESECVCVHESVLLLCVCVCVFLAVHVQGAGCWNPSTANYPNTINPNRCFTMLNAVTWRPDACQAIPFPLQRKSEKKKQENKMKSRCQRQYLKWLPPVLTVCCSLKTETSQLIAHSLLL